MDTAARSKAKAGSSPTVVADEETVAYLAKRHRVSAAIVREIIRRIGSAERSAVEREIRQAGARR